MDLASGLSAASQTLLILKQIKELDVSIDQAVFKAKLLDVQEATNEARSALLDAKQALLEKDNEIFELKRKLKAATSGEMCPMCSIGTLKLVCVSPHQSLGELGVQEKLLSCDNESCSHRETRIHDPLKMIDKS